RDGESDESECQPGGGEGLPQRIGSRPEPFDRIPVARDDEEAVIDRETQTDRDHEVEGVDREWRDRIRDAQPEEGSENRDNARPDRQQRRYDTAEDQEREQKEDREREHLRPGEILLDLIVDLLVRDVATSEEDGGIALEVVD